MHFQFDPINQHITQKLEKGILCRSLTVVLLTGFKDEKEGIRIDEDAYSPQSHIYFTIMPT